MAPTPPESRLQLRDQVLGLLCCVEEIDSILNNCDKADRWHWQSRRNTAVFLLNRIADSQSVSNGKFRFEKMSANDRRDIAIQHELLGPLIEYLPKTAAEIRMSLGNQIRKVTATLHSNKATQH